MRQAQQQQQPQAKQKDEDKEWWQPLSKLRANYSVPTDHSGLDHLPGRQRHDEREALQAADCCDAGLPRADARRATTKYFA
jgi:hypothetical protein